MSAQTGERKQSTGASAGRELHYYNKRGLDEAILEGRPFTYRALCGEVWTSEPGELGLLATEAEREKPRICLDCEWRYEQLGR